MIGSEYDANYEEPECTICGSYMEWQECHDCDDGYWDAYDEDPINESPGTVVCCHHCHGKGGYWECSALPHTGEQMAEWEKRITTPTPPP